MIILASFGLIGACAAAGWAQKTLLERSVLFNLPGYCEGAGEWVRASARSWGFLGVGVPIAEIHWSITCVTGASDNPIIRVDLSQCEATIIHAFQGTERKPWMGCPLIWTLSGDGQEARLQPSPYP